MTDQEHTHRRDFVVVSNRLPVDSAVSPDGTIRWQRSPGGLVAALEPVLRSTAGAWVGWPGSADLELAPWEDEGTLLVPVALRADDLAEYYEGFANDTLWPLHHDVIVPPTFHRQWWERYYDVNRRFADRVAEIAAPGGRVWVQDYQLELVPSMLRDRRPDLAVGFFLHIPQPPFGLFSQLPWRQQIVEGILGADVAGFQRVSDAQNFVTAVRRLTDYPVKTVGNRSEVQVGERTVIVKAFPISIDAAAFDALGRRPDIRARAEQIRADLGSPDVLLLGVDRLDYSKGIPHRLKAYGELVEDGELHVGQDLLVQVANPSRERVEAYRTLRDDVERTVGRINGDLGTLGHQAITYLHQGFAREEMAALYLAADVMVVTPLRDGMNLVAKEYAATRVDEDGVLLLSEFAGAADELPRAVLTNPHDIDGLKRAMLRAVRMPRAERRARMRDLRRRILRNDVQAWSSAFLDELDRTRATAPSVPAAPQVAFARRLLRELTDFAGRPHLLVALDFDGTLAPLVPRPADARPLPQAVEAIRALHRLDDTTVAIVTGRSLEDLQALDVLPPGLILIGSHGSQTNEVVGATGPSPEERALLDEFEPIAAAVVAAHPGTWLEAKPFGYAVHTRGGPAETHRSVHQSLRREVKLRIAASPQLRLVAGGTTVELVIRSATKGSAVHDLAVALGATTLFAGDDTTDEDVFPMLRQGDLGIRIGDGVTQAEHRLADPAELAELLSLLVDLRRAASDG